LRTYTGNANRNGLNHHFDTQIQAFTNGGKWSLAPAPQNYLSTNFVLSLRIFLNFVF